MAEATPVTGTEQAPSIESRLASFISKQDEEPPEQQDDAAPAQSVQTEQAPEGQAPQELTPDDIPDVETPAAQPAVDEAFEFDAAGQRLRLTRDETIKYAQQGFDYTQKTMALAEQAKQLAERQQRVLAIEQVQPHLQQARAQIEAFNARLQPFSQVDWVQLATNDPLEYSKVRAQYDVLVQGYNQAAGQYQQVSNAIEQQRQVLAQQHLQQEGQKLYERIPEWKDPEKFKAGQQSLRTYLLSEGATPEDVDGLNSSVAVAVAYKAMLYDRLSKAKNEKVKQLRTAPPMTRPGAVQSGQAGADKQAELSQRLHKTGDLKDAAALLFNRMK